MNDTLVQSFLAIATEGGFNKAAEKIYISQPNLSRNIARLEKELGTKLFDRSQKRAVLTPAGNIYFAAFRKMVYCMEQAKEQVKTLENEARSLIRIGYVNGWNVSGWIQPVLQALREKCPDDRAALEACGMADLSSRLSLGQLDLMITLKDRADSVYGAEAAGIGYASDLILYSREFFEKDGGKVRPEDFRNALFLLPADGREEFRKQYVRDIGAAYGFLPNIQTMNNMESVLMNVENGLGVTICNSWMRTSGESRFGVCRLNHGAEIGIAWKGADRNPALADFLEAVSEVYPEIGIEGSERQYMRQGRCAG